MQHEANPQIPVELLASAIQRRVMVRAVYNSTALDLAPHQIILRNDAFYLGAVNPDRKRRSDEEPSLGYFKVDGLSGLAVTESPFEPLPAQACTLPRADDQLVFAAE